MALTMIFEVVGGLGIFLLGMKNMSEGMQAVAGDRLRKMINAVTNNRILACLVGVIVTCLIQSSSITTVMVVGMVNAGIMNLMQAIGVVLGANIGTTITGWILVLKVGKYGLPIIGCSAFFFLFSKRERLRYIAMLVLGLGMIFFGLSLMKNGFKPLRSMDWFTEWFQAFRPEDHWGVIKCCLVGALLTAIVQSSSATLGITIGLATSGAIDYPTAAALVLGENIGTTITAFLASIGASTAAKRASYAHVFVNLFGVTWIILPFFWYIVLVRKFMGVDVGAENVALALESTADGAVALVDAAKPVMTEKQMTSCIAATHTCFNLINVIVLLPLTGIIAKVLQKLVPDKETPEATHLTYLDVRMVDTPTISIDQSLKETTRMGVIASEMLINLKESLVNPGKDVAKQESIFENENKLDFIQKEITEFLTKILAQSIPQDVNHEINHQLRMADEFESISDYITAILKLNLKITNNGEKITAQGLEDMLELHGLVASYLDYVNDAVQQANQDILPEAITRGNQITYLMKECRSRHLDRVAAGELSPLKSLAYTDMLNAYRRIKDHAYNIAEVVAGEK